MSCKCSYPTADSVTAKSGTCAECGKLVQGYWSEPENYASIFNALFGTNLCYNAVTPKRKVYMKGLQTEIPEGIELSARAIAILYQLEQNGKGAIAFNVDDSTDHYDDLRCLLEISQNVGYRLIRLANGGGTCEATGEKALKSGSWILVDEDSILRV